MSHNAEVKANSDVEAHAVNVPTCLAADRESLLIPQNGQAKAVLQDVENIQRTHETMALLMLLALGRQDIEASRTRLVDDVVTRLRAKHRTQTTLR